MRHGPSSERFNPGFRPKKARVQQRRDRSDTSLCLLGLPFKLFFKIAPRPPRQNGKRRPRINSTPFLPAPPSVRTRGGRQGPRLSGFGGTRHRLVNGRWKTSSTFFKKSFGIFIKTVSHFDGVCRLRPCVLKPVIY